MKNDRKGQYVQGGVAQQGRTPDACAYKARISNIPLTKQRCTLSESRKKPKPGHEQTHMALKVRKRPKLGIADLASADHEPEPRPQRSPLLA